MNYKRWNVEEISHHWNYNLHYLEYLIPLVVLFKESEQEKYLEKWEEILMSWIDKGSGDSFEPYTTSLRGPNVLIYLEIIDFAIDEKTERKICNSIYG